DIHEDVHNLRKALQRFRQEGVEQVVALGDVCDTGEHLDQTVDLLRQANAIGVWGNHDLGLCHEVDEGTRRRFPHQVHDFVRALAPGLEVESCLFTHGLPFWDATDPCIYYVGGKPEEPESLDRCFRASTVRVMFLGHFHRWVLVTTAGHHRWAGESPIR